MRVVRKTEHVVEGRPRLSQEIFGLDWSRILPFRVESADAWILAADHAEVTAFLSEHARTLLGPGGSGSVLGFDSGSRKGAYCDRVADAFKIVRDGSTIGVLVAEPSDWSSYYVRYMSVLPDQRGRGLVNGFFELFMETLARHGIDRLEADVAASHLAQLRRLIGLGFYVMGNTHSERFGALVRMVRFLDARCERAFLDRFCAGVRTETVRSPTRNREGGDRAEEVRPGFVLVD